MPAADDNRDSAGLRMWRFGCTLLTFFVISLTVGVLAVLVMSASACFWNLHVRCFSASRDTLGVISSAAKMWFALALTVALLAATIAQMYSALAWWTALIVVPASILVVGFLPTTADSLAREALPDSLFFFAGGLVLFAAYQLSRFVRKLIGERQS
jgi:hypothetical protein